MVKMLEKNRRMTVPKLAKEMNRTERTIYRDLKQLKELDVPLFFENGSFRIDTALWDTWISNVIMKTSQLA